MFNTIQLLRYSHGSGVWTSITGPVGVYCDVRIILIKSGRTGRIFHSDTLLRNIALNKLMKEIEIFSKSSSRPT